MHARGSRFPDGKASVEVRVLGRAFSAHVCPRCAPLLHVPREAIGDGGREGEGRAGEVVGRPERNQGPGAKKATSLILPAKQLHLCFAIAP